MSELTLFEDNTPIPDGEVLETLAAVYHGVVPAIGESNIEALGESLRVIQQVGFKRVEIALQSQSVRTVLSDLQTFPFLASGMSSMGPLVYSIFDSKHSQCVSRTVDKIAEESSSELLGVFSFRNAGFTVAQ